MVIALIQTGAWNQAEAQAPGPSPAPIRKLEDALHGLTSDAQMTHAIYGLYVKDDVTGKVVWDMNAQVGLAPASNQKLIVSAAALELLGEDFQFQTRLAYDGTIQQGTLNGNLYVVGSGDPSFGSWRYEGSRPEDVMDSLHAMLQRAGISRIDGDVLIDDHHFSLEPVPRGWVWEDLGNYYGAGARGLNWHENQYDLDLLPGTNEGDSVRFLGFHPALRGDTILNGLRTGPSGSGDESNIYLSPLSTLGYTTGTIPAGHALLTISGSIPDPEQQFGQELLAQCATWNISVSGKVYSNLDFLRSHRPFPSFNQILGSIPSPSLDSLVYWFLKKSINLYGEALVKAMALQSSGVGNTDTGIAVVRSFWAKRGIDPAAFHIMDGSGLSPQNRVTPYGLVQVLEYVKGQTWAKAFYESLPLINGITMKSGSIGGARAYSGYVGGKDGRRYTFSFIVNNYDGSGTDMQHKMWKVLDVLKHR
jgi:serine-type D-Ala-D-Ala carboxypeptidase/endopeptidase (penicillin-binding protein 4)